MIQKPPSEIPQKIIAIIIAIALLRNANGIVKIIINTAAINNNFLLLLTLRVNLSQIGIETRAPIRKPICNNN
ncbi:hypothetical protein ES703_114353 [subsurface metagenome]